MNRLLHRFPALPRVLLIVAGVLTAAAIVLPLWGMTLVSTQYPEGLRMVVYPGHIRGDLSEINALNRYIGMHPISDDFFAELRWLPLLFAGTAVLCLLAAVVRRFWAAFLPLVAISVTAVYGLVSMRRRLWQFGHELDPTAPIEIEAFTPPMLGQNQIAQFASYSYFSYGTLLPAIGAGMIVLALWMLRPTVLPRPLVSAAPFARVA
jgi:hypothetical protein